MKTKKQFTIEFDKEDGAVVRIGREKFRLVKLKADSRDRQHCWVWYETSDGVELQQVRILALQVTIMTLVKASI